MVAEKAKKNKRQSFSKEEAVKILEKPKSILTALSEAPTPQQPGPGFQDQASTSRN